VDSTPQFVRIGDEVLHAYNEVAFRYFLSLERKRAARSVRHLLLMLVKLRNRADIVAQPQAFATVFAALKTCTREVDVVGWYREGLVAAALFAANGPPAGTAREHVSARVLDRFRDALPVEIVAQLRTRIVSLRRPTEP
jgi:hypothetical protein